MQGSQVAHQGLLVQQLKTIFTEIHVNVLQQHKVNNYELDVWVSDHNLCFEFQDVYHYATTWYYQHASTKVQYEDQIKRNVVRKQGITLIVVPCWWDGSANSLMSTIECEKPGLISLHNNIIPPIPLNPPLDFFKAKEIPGIGELMLASFSLDKSIVRRNKWWMGEKYDGIRCCWIPDVGQLYTRNGNTISLIEPISKHMPSTFVDAELWMGRGWYEHVVGILSGTLNLVRWHFLRMIAFDVPAQELENMPFEERYSNLFSSISSHHPLVIVASRWLRTTTKQQQQIEQQIVRDGGEGIILRKIASKYERGRNSSLIKIKGGSAREDREGVVVLLEPNSFVRLRIASGKTFDVTWNNLQVIPSVGEIVSFSFDGRWRNEVPVDPIIYRIRHDMSWEDIISNSSRERNNINKETLQKHKDKPNSSRFTFPRSSLQDVSNRRKFFEDFAKANNIDPHNPKHWANTPTDKILAIKGAYAVMSYHRGSVAKALFDLFPNIDWQTTKYSTPVEWHASKANRKKFFEDYADRNSFDPQVANNWYLQPRKKIMAEKGVASVIYHHQNNLAKALLDLFPKIGLEKTKLKRLTLWYHPENRRKFFEKYAKDNQFNPLHPENWYAQPREKILAAKGATSIVHYHQKSITKALIELFPEMKLDRSRLWTRFSSQREMRRNFFEIYAKDNNFNPLVAENWYLQSYSKIASTKGAANVMDHYGNDLSEALSSLFPKIGLDKSKLKVVLSPWNAVENRRQFFVKFAQDNNFDPFVADNWYKIHKENLMAVEGSFQVLSYYSRNLSSALVSLFPEISFNDSKFNKRRKWDDKQKRREFFINYAQQNSFDPLNPVHWYLHPKEKILSAKGTSTVVTYHKSSISRTLLDLFPDIGLDRVKLQGNKKIVVVNNLYYIPLYLNE